MNVYTQVPAITYAMAAEIVAKAMELAAESGVRGVVAVSDPAMQLVAFGRADGATPHSVETSTRKAFTAASTRKPSAAIAAEFAVALEHGTGGRLTSIPGGVPLVFDGVHVGGLGVAGGPPATDAEIATAVLASIGADPQ